MNELRRVLGDAVRSSRIPRREIERAMGLGNGSLARVLTGEMEIRVRHLLGLADLLGVPPGDFFDLAFSERSRSAPHRLSEWVGAGTPAGKLQPREEVPTTIAALKDLIREVLREELEGPESGAAHGDLSSQGGQKKQDRGA